MQKARFKDICIIAQKQGIRKQPAPSPQVLQANHIHVFPPRARDRTLYAHRTDLLQVNPLDRPAVSMAVTGAVSCCI